MWPNLCHVFCCSHQIPKFTILLKTQKSTRKKQKDLNLLSTIFLPPHAPEECEKHSAGTGRMAGVNLF